MTDVKITVNGITSTRFHNGEPSVYARRMIEIFDDGLASHPMIVGNQALNSYTEGDICEPCWLKSGYVHGTRTWQHADPGEDDVLW